MISANGGLPAHRYTPQVTPRWPRGFEPASPLSTNQSPQTIDRTPHTTHHRPQTTDHRAPTTDHRPQTTDHKSQTIDNGQPTKDPTPHTTDHRPTDHRPPTTDHTPQTTHHSPPTTDHRPRNMHHTPDHLLSGSWLRPSPPIQRDNINSDPLYWRGACTHAMTLHANIPYKNIFHDTCTVKQARGEAGEKEDRLNRLD